MISEKFYRVWITANKVGGKKSLKWGIISVFSGLLVFGFDLFFAICLKRFFVSIDLIPLDSNTDFLGVVGGAKIEVFFFLGVGFLRALSIWLNGIALGYTQVFFEVGARRKISKWAIFDGKSSMGYVSSLFNDFVVSSAAGVSNIYFLFGRILMMIGSLITLLFFSYKLTLIILALTTIIIPVQKLLDKKLNRVANLIQTSFLDFSNNLLNSVKNILYLMFHGLSVKEYNKQNNNLLIYQNSSKKYYKYSSARAIIPQLFGLVTISIIALQSESYFISQKSIFVSYLYLVLRFFQTISEAARVSANIKGNYPRIVMLTEWFNSKYSNKQLEINTLFNSSELEKIRFNQIQIELKDLEHSWGSLDIIKKLNLTIEKGSITLLKGPSGVGKTTLFLIISGLVKPNKGEIILHTERGSYLLDDVSKELMNSISYVGPDPFISANTIRNFLIFGNNRKISDKKINEILDIANCNFVFDLPLGLNFYINENNSELSTGQKQRLSIARALLRDPSLLILDEATSNLDLIAEKKIIETINNLKNKVTVLITSHRDSMIGIANKTLFFEGNGKINIKD